MTFSPTQAEILVNAYLLSLEGKGQVVEDWAVPDAHELCEAGWLDRHVKDGQLAWFWSAKAENALKLSALTRVDGRDN